MSGLSERGGTDAGQASSKYGPPVHAVYMPLALSYLLTLRQGSRPGGRNRSGLDVTACAPAAACDGKV